MSKKSACAIIAGVVVLFLGSVWIAERHGLFGGPQSPEPRTRTAEAPHARPASGGEGPNEKDVGAEPTASLRGRIGNYRFAGMRKDVRLRLFDVSAEPVEAWAEVPIERSCAEHEDRFAIDGLGTGEYRLDASWGGEVVETHFVIEKGGDLVEVFIDMSALDPLLDTRICIAGRAYLASRETPLRNAHFHIRLFLPQPAMIGSSAETDDCGDFLNTHSPPYNTLPGGTQVMLAHPGCKEILLTLERTVAGLDYDPIFEPLTYERVAVFKTTSGTPFPGAKVSLRCRSEDPASAEDRFCLERRTNERGEVSLDGLVGSLTEGSLTYKSFREWSSAVTEKEYRFEPAGVGAGGDPTRLSFTVAADRLVRFRILAPDPALAPGCMLYAWVPGSVVQIFFKPDDIPFVADVPDEGELRVLASTWQFRNRETGRLEGRPTLYGMASFPCSEIGGDREAAIELKPLERARIRILVPDGEPVTDAYATPDPSMAFRRVFLTLRESLEWRSPFAARDLDEDLGCHLSDLFLSADREDPGRWSLGFPLGIYDRIFVASTAGGAVLDAGGFAEVRSEGTLRLRRDLVVSGKVEFAEGFQGQRRCRVIVEIADGRILETNTIADGSYAVFVGEEDPLLVGIKAGDREVKWLRNPGRGFLGTTIFE